jgi:hypothetical protein
MPRTFIPWRRVFADFLKMHLHQRDSIWRRTQYIKRVIQVPQAQVEAL